MNMVNNGLGSGFYPGSILGFYQLMEVPEDPHLQGIDSGENQNQMVVPQVLPQLGTKITGLDDPSFNKVTKLSAEQRKEKIHMYMKKRNERNFSKKIKYACRKTLADSRPRVRGRFAKNDEFGELNRQTCSSHFEEDDDYIRLIKLV